MGCAIEITRRDLSSAELRRIAARQTDDVRVARRLLAIAMVLDGEDRKTAAESAGMDRQTLRDWVHRYNELGVAGLANIPAKGREPKLDAAQKAEIARWIETGPDIEADGVVRWRCVDLQARIAARFNVSLHERSVGKLLKKLGYRRLSVRPQHPKSDLQAQEIFKKTSTPSSANVSPPKHSASRSRSGSKTKPEWVSKEA
jgi:transposase